MLRALLILLAVLCAPAQAGVLGHMLALAADSVADAGAAARAAAQRTGGRVLDVQSRRAGGRPVYDVKVLLDDGRVRIIQFEGRNGAGRPGADD